jgi:hypothetical protein
MIHNENHNNIIYDKYSREITSAALITTNLTRILIYFKTN